MKCLEIARLQDFAPNTPGFLAALSGPRPPYARCAIRDASRRTPLWKFLPTGLSTIVIVILFSHLLSNMSSSSTMISNADVINSRKSTGSTMTAQWMVKLINCNLNSTKVAVSRLWNDYEKFRKSRSQIGGEKKLSEFLNTKFIPPQRASVVSTRPQENICLVDKCEWGRFFNSNVHIKIAPSRKSEFRS